MTYNPIDIVREVIPMTIEQLEANSTNRDFLVQCVESLKQVENFAMLYV